MRSINKYLKVEGHGSIVRDSSTKAIVDLNDKEYEAYKARRKRELENSNSLKKQAEEIESLRSELSEIKAILLKMIKEN